MIIATVKWAIHNEKPMFAALLPFSEHFTISALIFWVMTFLFFAALPSEKSPLHFGGIVQFNNERNNKRADDHEKQYLIDAGANVNAQTSTGDTALTYACENGHTDVADLLLQARAYLEHESEGGRTPLMKACRAGHLCTVQFLIVKEADVNKTTTNNDHTPLSLACAGGHVPVVELLLVRGADPHHKLKDNSTMLMEASRGGHTKVVQLLIDFPSSISHLLPVVPAPQHPVTGSNQGPAAELSAGAILEGDPHQLPMGLTVVQGSETQQSLVVNPTQIFNDIDDREGLVVGSNATGGMQSSGMKISRGKANRKSTPSSALPAAVTSSLNSGSGSNGEQMNPSSDPM
ncbi:hypothetical protein SK128_004712, partial [Halocaridina rubra]